MGLSISVIAPVARFLQGRSAGFHAVAKAIVVVDGARVRAGRPQERTQLPEKAALPMLRIAC